MGNPIIPPLSVVRFVRCGKRTSAWKKDIGRTFRIGYYCRHCGKNVVWLVNDAGQYEQTMDQEGIRKYFEVIERSHERALFGRNRPQIGRLSGRTSKGQQVAKTR